ncbi:MAG: SRPBCC family protein [Acidobacteriota bacterium]
MGFELDHSVNVAAPADIVWRLLIDPSSWSGWWRDCLDAQSRDLRNLREGSELSLTVQPKHMRMTFEPRVDLMIEQKTLSMSHRSALVQASLSWYLGASEMGTRVQARVVFAGLWSNVMGLTRQKDAVHFAVHSNLRDLKKVAERLT